MPETQQSYTLSGLTPGTYFVQVCISNEINYRKMYHHITAYKTGTYLCRSACVNAAIKNISAGSFRTRYIRV